MSDTSTKPKPKKKPVNASALERIISLIFKYGAKVIGIAKTEVETVSRLRQELEPESDRSLLSIAKGSALSKDAHKRKIVATKLLEERGYSKEQLKSKPQ